MKKITVRIEHKDNGWHDCEYCGGTYQDELSYYVNDNLVWHHYNIGCYGGDTSDGTEIGNVIQEVRNIIENDKWDEDCWVTQTQEDKDARWEEVLGCINNLVCYTDNQLQILRIFLNEDFDVDLEII